MIVAGIAALGAAVAIYGVWEQVVRVHRSRRPLPLPRWHQ